jgi:hypothetical protein
MSNRLKATDAHPRRWISEESINGAPPQEDHGQRYEFLLVAPPGLVEAIAGVIAAEVRPSIAAREDRWQLWNIEETGARLGRSERWIRERVRRGDLPHVKLDGGALAFDPEDVRRFAASRRVPASSTARQPASE